MQAAASSSWAAWADRPVLRHWPLALLAALALAWHLPLLAAPADRLVAAQDYVENFRWTHEYIRQSFRAGRVPLWYPHLYCGVPFVATPSTAVFYPPTLLCALMPVPMAERWFMVMHVALAGCFMHVFLRDRKLGSSACLAGSLAWMLGSYFQARLAMGHFIQVAAGAWMPLALWCWWRALERRSRRWAMCGGAVLGVQFLAGDPQIVYFTALALAASGLTLALGDGQPADWSARRGALLRLAGALSLAGAAAAAVAAVHLAPALEMIPHSDRAGNSFEFITQHSLSPAGLVALARPWRIDTDGFILGPGGEHLLLRWEMACYVGLATLALAAAALARRWSATVGALAALAALALVLMLGHHTPVYRGLLAALPGLGMFRVPARAAVLLGFALAALAAFGYASLFEDRSSDRPGARALMVGAIPLALAAAGVLALGLYPGLHHISLPLLGDGPPTFTPIRLSNAWFLIPIAVAGATAALWAGLRWAPARWAGALVLALLVADLLTARASPPLVSVADLDQAVLPALNRLRQPLASAEGPWRVDLPALAMPANAVVGAGLDNANGYWPVALARYYRLAHTLRDAEPSPLLRHTIMVDHYQRLAPRFHRLFNIAAAMHLRPGSQRAGIVIFNPPAPRAWLVHRARVAADADEALRLTAALDADVHRVAVLEAPPPPGFVGDDAAPPPPPAVLKIRAVPGGGLDIDTQSSQPGLLVLSEVHYPGWVARVDDRPVPLRRADYALTALPLPAGAHRVTYRYEPWSFKIGAAITLVAVGGLAATMMRRGRGDAEVAPKR